MRLSLTAVLLPLALLALAGAELVGSRRRALHEDLCARGLSGLLATLTVVSRGFRGLGQLGPLLASREVGEQVERRRCALARLPETDGKGGLFGVFLPRESLGHAERSPVHAKDVCRLHVLAGHEVVNHLATSILAPPSFEGILVVDEGDGERGELVACWKVETLAVEAVPGVDRRLNRASDFVGLQERALGGHHESIGADLCEPRRLGNGPERREPRARRRVKDHPLALGLGRLHEFRATDVARDRWKGDAPSGAHEHLESAGHAGALYHERAVLVRVD